MKGSHEEQARRPRTFQWEPSGRRCRGMYGLRRPRSPPCLTAGPALRERKVRVPPSFAAGLPRTAAPGTLGAYRSVSEGKPGSELKNSPSGGSGRCPL
ncbi:unnamed protein product [Coccothraustes coccothraustes]